MKKYPVLEIDLKKLKENITNILKKSNEKNINITGVIKGVNGDEKIIKCFISSGVKSIASSRYEHLKKVKEISKSITTMMIRIPLLTEKEEIIKYCDISLNSEYKTIKVLNEEAKRQNKTHKIILMVDLGDLREGYFNYEELINDAVKIENELENIKLIGIGTNLGCYGSVKPTVKNLNLLGDIKEKIEKKIDRKLEIISGGSSTSYELILNNTIPKCINNLRIGEHILLRYDLPTIKDTEIHNDAFILKTTVIEKKVKPTYPIGERYKDSFGNIKEYEDLGEKTRIILGIGNQDIGSYTKIKPINKDIKIIGASSDHLIAITDKNIEVGDELSFLLTYESLLFLTQSPYIAKKYKEN